MPVKYHVATAIALIATPAAAQSAEPGESEGAAIVVTASRTPQPAIETGQAITVIDLATIEARQSLNVTDLLRSTPGVTFARNGGLGGVASVFIRGADSSQTLVLIDGVRINDPSAPSGAYDFGSLTTANLDRIEVLRGPNSVIWGSQAIGGIVAIETKPPTEKLQLAARAEYGGRDTFAGSANVSGTAGIIAASIGGGYLSSDGISALSAARGGVERDPFDTLHGNARVTVRPLNILEIDLRGYYSDSDIAFDNPPADTLPVSDVESFTGYAGINLTLFDGVWRNRLAYTRTDVRRVTTDPDPLSFNPARAQGTLDRFEYQGVAELARAVTLVFGAEREESQSVTLFGRSGDPDRLNVAIDSIYGQAIVRPLPGLTLTGGVRHDDHGSFGGETTFGANAAWALSEGRTILRGTYAEGFRAPSLSEALSPFGNPDLLPERARSYDIGIEQSALDGRVRATLTWFRRTLRDQIVFSGDSFTLENVARTRAKGVEVTAEIRPVDALAVTAQYSWIDTENRSLEPDFTGAVNFGNDLARRPEQTASISADYTHPGTRFALGATVTHVGDSFDDFANAVPLDGYVLVDVRARYPVTRSIELYARVENLFDEEYETAFRFGTLPRTVHAGIRLAL